MIQKDKIEVGIPNRVNGGETSGPMLQTIISSRERTLPYFTKDQAVKKVITRKKNSIK